MDSAQARRLLAFGHDVVAAALAWWIAHLFRLAIEFEPSVYGAMWRTVAWVVPLEALVFVAFGLYRGLWRFASLTDLRRILLAAVVGAVLIPLVIVLFRVQDVVPRSVLLLNPLFLVFLMGGSRFAYRMWREHRLYSLTKAMGEPVLIIGADETAARIVRELWRSRQWRVVGLLDDDPSKLGYQLHGHKVLGSIDELARWAREFAVRQVIVAIPGASPSVRRKMARLCAEAGVEALVAPDFGRLLSGKDLGTTLRHIELEDLLGREPVQLDDTGLDEWLGGRTVLVTGAGGSIGCELCRQIARFRPRRLALLEASEYALYQIELALKEEFPGLDVAPFIGDVKNEARVEEILAREAPHVVFHAAAYKHVPLMEQGNAWEALRNNTLGTLVIARAAKRHAVDRFVLVSTDKAVNPTSVMGASKRLAEMACQALQNGRTRFVVVRFGNVIGSAGSVIPRFRQQIDRGGPVTVTHPEVVRYFMSIAEAAQLVLQAGMIGAGGEIIVLDMGEPVRIADLARDLIRLSGISDDRIPIVYTGLRPGEKLFEEPLTAGEDSLPTPHPKLRVAVARPVPDDLLDALHAWLAEPVARADDEVRERIARWLPEFRPFATGPAAETARAGAPAAEASTVAAEAEASVGEGTKDETTVPPAEPRPATAPLAQAA